MTADPLPLPEPLRDLLARAVAAGASDLHLIPGYPPVLRLHGELSELPDPPLGADDTHAMLTALCPTEALTRLQAQKNYDLSFETPVEGHPCRFRANLFHAG